MDTNLYSSGSETVYLLRPHVRQWRICPEYYTSKRYDFE
jgi:hypothetical protein